MSRFRLAPGPSEDHVAFIEWSVRVADRYRGHEFTVVLVLWRGADGELADGGLDDPATGEQRLDGALRELIEAEQRRFAAGAVSIFDPWRVCAVVAWDAVIEEEPPARPTLRLIRGAA